MSWNADKGLGPINTEALEEKPTVRKEPDTEYQAYPRTPYGPEFAPPRDDD